MPERDENGSDGDGIMRLLGMVVQEVSLVDRAANKRKFLIVKRDETMTTQTDVRKDGNSGEPSQPGSAAPPAAKLPPMQAQVKDSLLAALTSACEKLMSIANGVKEADVSDQASTPAVPDSVTGELGEVASMLQGLQSQYGAAAAAAPSDAGTGAEPAKGAALPGVTDNGGQDQQGAQKAAVEAVQKAGAKMAKERLDRFRKAIDLLAGVMKELQSQATRKSATPAPKMIPLAKVEEVIKAGEEMTALLEKMSGDLKSANNEIAQLKKNVGASNALPGNGESAPSKKIDWPLDLNQPMKVRKSADFTSSPTTGR